MSDLIPIERIESKILIIREQKVLLDYDLAVLYDLPVGRLNEAVKRKIKRFPSNFMFQLNNKEFTTLKSQFAIANVGRGGRRTPPYAFTEQGVAMLSSVLNTERAIQVNIAIINTFVKIRKMIRSDELTKARLDDFEDRLGAQEMQTLSVLDQLGTIKKTLKPSKKIANAIGFHQQ